MLGPHMAGGSPVICRIIAHSRRASSRRRSSGTRARKSSTDAPVRRIAGLFSAGTLGAGGSYFEDRDVRDRGGESLRGALRRDTDLLEEGPGAPVPGAE